MNILTKVRVKRVKVILLFVMIMIVEIIIVMIVMKYKILTSLMIIYMAMKKVLIVNII